MALPGPSTQKAHMDKKDLLALMRLLSALEPVAHLWQHAETGHTRIVMSGDVWTANDRWCYVGPLVLGSTHPAEPTA